MPWLEPDINDHLTRLAADGVAGIVCCPVGFVSDHLEVLWDLDTEAAATAEKLGLRFIRSATAWDDPRFVAMVRELIAERVDGVPRRALGTPPAEGVDGDRCCPR
jgi:ferrochelatase